MENCKDCEIWRMAAEMASHEAGFYSCWDKDAKDPGLSFCLILNDVFGPMADCETISFEEIPKIYKIWKGDDGDILKGEFRLVEYVSKKRGIIPWEKYVNFMKKEKYNNPWLDNLGN
jgi:hypothetical protein